jgi:hypothetical protein
MRTGLILGVLLLLTWSCRKQDGFESRLYGKVLNAETGANVNGANVAFSQQLVSGGAFNANWQTVGSSTTSGGSYDFTFERENAASFRVEVDHDLYFDLTKNINPDNLRTGEELQLDLEMTARAYLKVSIVNTAPLNDQDELVYRNLNADYACDCCDEEEVVLNGTDIDTSWVCELPGYTNLVYRFDVDKDTLDYIEFDTLYITPFDTSYITINY